MNAKTIKQLTKIAQERQVKDDPTHDFEHIKRVTNMAIKIAGTVGADLDVVIPAALFHDTVVYPKDSPQSAHEANESAEVAGELLRHIKSFPVDKIELVKTCISECSFTKGIMPGLLESKVLQDADMLESVGAVAVMRVFSAGGKMNRGFYLPTKTLQEKYEKEARTGVGMFYRRLFVIESRMHTALGKRLAKKRTIFLRTFLAQFTTELQEAGIIT